MRYRRSNREVPAMPRTGFPGLPRNGREYPASDNITGGSRYPYSRFAYRPIRSCRLYLTVALRIESLGILIFIHA
jgi:hypothetical protein